MRFKSILAGTAVAVTLLISAETFGPLRNILVSPAEAGVSVSFGIFYDELAQDGDWVFLDGSYVFVPARVDVDWRPYTVGHWTHSRRYGWIWVSEERFGWATYHYGRWGYSNEIGWYWVPGRRWAPAWVSWRRSHDHVIWAPLPPGRDEDDVTVNVSVEDIPDYYWVAVPSVNFFDININVAIINNDEERDRVVHSAKPIGSVVIQNNIVVNNFIDVKSIEEETGKAAPVADIRVIEDPKQAKSEDTKGKGKEVAVFTGEISDDKKEKPPEVKKIEAVKQEKPKVKQEAKQTSKNVEDQPANADQPAKAGDEPAKAGDQPAAAEKQPADAPVDQSADAPVKAEEPNADPAQPTDPAVPADEAKPTDKKAGSDEAAPADQAAPVDKAKESKKPKAKASDEQPADAVQPSDQPADAGQADDGATPKVDEPTAAEQPEKSTNEKKKAKKAKSADQAPADNSVDAPPVDEAAPAAEQPAEASPPAEAKPKPTNAKKAKKAKASDQPPAEGQPADEPAPAVEQPAGEQPPAAEGQPPKKKTGKPAKCDPAADPNCAAQ